MGANFGVRLAGAMVKPLAYDASICNDDSADQRIRRGIPPGTPRQFIGTREIEAVERVQSRRSFLLRWHAPQRRRAARWRLRRAASPRNLPMSSRSLRHRQAKRPLVRQAIRRANKNARSRPIAERAYGRAARISRSEPEHANGRAWSLPQARLPPSRNRRRTSRRQKPQRRRAPQGAAA